MPRLLLNKYYFLIIIFVIAIAYFPILNNDFLFFWDDQWVVMNYYTEGGGSFSNLWSILTNFYHGQYAPLNEFLYLILYNLFGYNPFWFHISSMILHIFNSILVFFVLSKLLSLSNKVNPDYIKILSLLTAIIFALNPINVESVAWVSASKVLMYSFYYLLATYSFLKYLNNQKRRYYILTLILFIFSFLSKEQAVTFPVFMLLIYWFLDYDLKCKKIWTNASLFFLLSFVFGILTICSQLEYGGGALSDEASYSFWQRIIYACYAFTEYLFKCILPFKLSYLYPYPSQIGEPLPTWLLIYPLMLVTIIFCLWKYLRQGLIAFGLIYFFIHICITLHIISLSRFTVVADRYAYLSSVGTGLISSFLFIQLYHKYNKIVFLRGLHSIYYIHGHLFKYTHTCLA